MIVAGKCPPEKEELRKASERGFEKVELYLEKKHLETPDDIVENVESSDIDVDLYTPLISISAIAVISYWPTS